MIRTTTYDFATDLVNATADDAVTRVVDQIAENDSRMPVKVPEYNPLPAVDGGRILVFDE